MDARAKARSLLDPIFRKGEITSKYNATEFDRQCAPVAQIEEPPGSGIIKPGVPFFKTWQERLEYNWANGGIMTCCNAFVGRYGANLGIPFYIGGFDLEGTLEKFGYSHAWVKSADGVTPQLGDILRFNVFHVGVAYEVVPGGTFQHVSAGQGGKLRGFDVLKLVSERVFYHPGLLQGWIDIELLFDPSKKVPDAPPWLNGYWYIKWEGENYYYWFGAGGVAQYAHHRPSNLKAPPPNPHDKGKYTVTGETVRVRWNTTGSVEVFYFNPSNPKNMTGNWNDGDPLVATKV
jgi:hypothetical protein